MRYLSAAVVAVTVSVGVAVYGALVLSGDMRGSRGESGPADRGPHESTPPSNPGATVLPDRVLFDYSAGGDIRAQTRDGEVVELTSGPEQDRHPSMSPDGAKIVFQRSTESDGGGPRLVLRELSTGDERTVGSGAWPIFGPDGSVAWVRPTGAERNEIVIERPGSDTQTVLNLLPDYSEARHLTWAPDGSAIYYEAGRSIVQHFVDEAVEPFPMTPRGVTNPGGAVAFVSPGMSQEDRVHLLRLCCRDDRGGPSSLDVGEIEFSEGGPLYGSVAAVDPREVSPRAAEYFAVYAGHLTVEGEQSPSWVTDAARQSWLISDGESLYLVDDEGRSWFVTDFAGHEDEVGAYAGMAMSPLHL
ncbi:MAG: TolB family protein [Actinomycetota bacterium]